MQHWKVYIRDHPRFGPWYRQVERRPSWVVKAALIAAGLVIVVPVVLLTLAAIVVGIGVFLVLGLVGTLAGLMGQLFGSDNTPGTRPATGDPHDKQPNAGSTRTSRRHNVRIIER